MRLVRLGVTGSYEHDTEPAKVNAVPLFCAGPTSLARLRFVPIRAFQTQANKTVSPSSLCKQEHIRASKFTTQAVFLISVKLFPHSFLHRQSCDPKNLQSFPYFSNEAVSSSAKVSIGLQGYQAL
jgi:hypothetical protein